jgi:uncharacterized pyridoxamine 5'-phosphate oxidase family protein
MKDIVKFLEENYNGFLATLENGKPRVRPYRFVMEIEGKLCFATNNTKEVGRQLAANPAMEFSSSSKPGGWPRVNGDCKFVKDMKIKEKVIAESEYVKGFYKTADNPAFEVFYLDHGNAQIMDAPGQEIKKIEF